MDSKAASQSEKESSTQDAQHPIDSKEDIGVKDEVKSSMLNKSPQPSSRSSPEEQPQQQHNDNASQQEDDTEPESDPDEPLDEKDWQELESRYHRMVGEINDDEKALLEEFESLLRASIVLLFVDLIF